MAEQAQKKSRNIVHCLRCNKPQETLPVHLARVCMKKSTPEEIAAEVQKARASSREWVRANRTWNYNHLCEILPHRPSRFAMVKELLERGFFITNKPHESEMALDSAGDAHSQAVCKTRYNGFMEGSRSVKECQEILKVARADFLNIFGKFISDTKVSESDKTTYRYYCEAVMVLRHFQRPGAVEGMTVSEWVNRKQVGGRVVTGISQHKTATVQVASLALTQEEEAWFQVYYKCIRPGYLSSYCDKFFISSSGNPVRNVTNDINRLHESYNVKPATSQEVRRAATFTERNTSPEYSSDTHLTSPPPSMDNEPSGKDFSAFVTRFPVSTDGQPPTKKKRVDAGFPDDRVFYDKWRGCQYAQREEYLLSHFNHRKPSAGKVARLIEKEEWKANHPKPEEILQMWKPAPKLTIESDEVILKSVSRQTWNLAIKDFGGEKGLGVVATRPFSKGDIVCDYHGKVITAAEGRAMMQDLEDEAGDLFFFKAGQRDLCIDAQTFPCKCHPNADTVGRRINHSTKRPNLEPLHCVLKVDGEDMDVVLFKALQDIKVDTELKFDYSVKSSVCDRETQTDKEIKRESVESF